jgi:hypothetical protein
MKKLLYAFTILTILFTISCEKQKSKEEKAKDLAEFKRYTNAEVERAMDKDEKTTWADAKKLPQIIFSNKITLKDGQTSEAGLSFLLKYGGKTVLASCKHILGTAGASKKR